MTDSICHSSLPRTVLEKVCLTTIQFRIHPRTKVDPMFQCVYISTPLKSCPYKSSATCAWSMARVENICANNKGADQPARPHRLISTFVVRCSSFFSTKKRLTNLNGEQNDIWNLLVSHRICHFRAIQSFDSNIGKMSNGSSQNTEGSTCTQKYADDNNTTLYSFTIRFYGIRLQFISHN